MLIMMCQLQEQALFFSVTQMTDYDQKQDLGMHFCPRGCALLASSLIMLP